MKKKLGLLVLLLLIVFGTVACGKNSGKPQQEFAYVPQFLSYDASYDYLTAVAQEEDTLYLLGSRWEEETGLQSTYLYIYDLMENTGREGAVDMGNNANISHMAIGADGSLLAIVNNYEYITNDEGDIIDGKSSLELCKLSNSYKSRTINYHFI